MKATYIYIFFKILLFIFRERGREGEREGEKHQCVVASHMAPTGDLAQNPGMCPAWRLNWQPFGSHPELSPELHQPGPVYILHMQLIWLSIDIDKDMRYRCLIFLSGS